MRLGISVGSAALVCALVSGCATQQVAEVVTVEAAASPYHATLGAHERLGEAPRIPGWSDAAHLRAVERLVDPTGEHRAAEALVFQTDSIKLSGNEGVVAAVERLFADRLARVGSETAVEISVDVFPILRSVAPKPAAGSPVVLRTPPDRPLFSAVCLDPSAFEGAAHELGADPILRGSRLLTRDGLPAKIQVVYPLAKLTSSTCDEDGNIVQTIAEDERAAGLDLSVLPAFASEDLIVGHLELSYSEPVTEGGGDLLWELSILRSPSTRISEPFALRRGETLWLYLADPVRPDYVLCALLSARPGRSQG